MSKVYVRLPNNQVAPLVCGFVKVQHTVNIQEYMGRPVHETFAEWSAAAIGAPASVARFEIVGAPVGGYNVIDLYLENTFEEVSLDSIEPMDFKVDVTRIAYGSRSYTVKARSLDEARQMASNLADDDEFSSHSSDYEFDVTPLTQEDHPF